MEHRATLLLLPHSLTLSSQDRSFPTHTHTDTHIHTNTRTYTRADTHTTVSLYLTRGPHVDVCQRHASVATQHECQCVVIIFRPPRTYDAGVRVATRCLALLEVRVVCRGVCWSAGVTILPPSHSRSVHNGDESEPRICSWQAWDWW